MNNIKILTSDKDKTVFLIQDNIHVTLVAENFNKNGEMLIEFDDKILTEKEVTLIVNSYFQNLIDNLEKEKIS